MIAPGQPSTVIRSQGRVVLTADQHQAFQRDGFLVLEHLADQAETARLRACLARLYVNQAGWAVGQQFDLGGPDSAGAAPVLPQILNPSRFEPGLCHSTFRDDGGELAHQLLGGERGEIEMNIEHAILKPGSYGAQTPWHQDEAYWRMPDHDARAVALWMALQDATVANGCLWYLPGSQRGPIRVHQPIGNDPAVHGLETLDVDPSAAVAVPMSAGSVVIHHVRCLHYAGANTTPAPRYAYTLGYLRPSVPAAQPHHMPWLERHQPASQERSQAAAQAG